MAIVALTGALALASAPQPRLYSLPPSAVAKCKRMQVHVSFDVLCPARLPRPTRGWRRRDRPPPFHSDIYGAPGHPELRTPYGLEFGYSAPVEPQSGRSWRRLLWHNRPCCFLHFTIFHTQGAWLPPGLMQAKLGRRRGFIRYATGYGLRGNSGFWWSNHTWFLWREGGVQYAASLHYFGPGTTQLLGRLLEELRPADRLQREARPKPGLSLRRRQSPSGFAQLAWRPSTVTSL